MTAPTPEQMLPGTTFTATVRFLVGSDGTARANSGFDGSTIGNVTPPAAECPADADVPVSLTEWRKQAQR